MAAEDDPLGYYRALGLAPNATRAQIQHAYREWAKTLHPDVSGKTNAEDFHRIKQAYDTLIDESLRARYDALADQKSSNDRPAGSDVSNTPKNSETAGKRALEAIRCCSCGSISAQPRYCVFDNVISALFFCRINHVQGVFCPSCAAKKSLRESAISWLFGWWSVVGISRTPIALYKNAMLGEKPHDINARLLIAQAVYFASLSNLTLAVSCLKQAKSFASGEDAENIIALEMSFTTAENRVVKNQWISYKRREIFGHFLPVFFVAVATWFYLPAIDRLNAAYGGSANGIQPPPAGRPLALPPRDIRYVAAARTKAWAFDNGKYVEDGDLTQFTTVDVKGLSADPKFVIALLPDGRTRILPIADLGIGDGAAAKSRWCEQSTQPYPFNNEIFRKSLAGENRAVVSNSGNLDAFVKFRNSGGSVVVSLFVRRNSQAVVESFPSGSYRLEFATGLRWSRQCGIFLQQMQIERFPKFDTFSTWITTDTSQGQQVQTTHSTVMNYTITPVAGGNVQAQNLDEDEFILDHD